MESITYNGISIRTVIKKGGKYIFISQGETYFIRTMYEEEKVVDIINALSTARDNIEMKNTGSMLWV